MEEERDLVEEYISKSLPEKRKELGKTIAEMTFMTEKLLHDLNTDYEVKPVQDYDNLFDSVTSEEEYLNGLYEDVLELQDVMGAYYTFATSLYYEDDAKEDMN